MSPLLKKGRATFADIAHLGGEARVEIIGGEIVQRGLPTPEHGVAQRALSEFVGPFVRKPGGRWPGGWWIGSEVDVQYAPHEVYCHDLVGWRRESVGARPSERPVRSRPDWVCEILSTNKRRDFVDKFRTLERAGVPFYWILDPGEKELTVYRHSEGKYVEALVATAGQAVRAMPFDAIEVRVSVLLGDEDPEE